MMTTVKIAWRNIWRTPLRSLIVIGSIVLGIWAGIFVIAFCYGLNSQRTVNRIESAVSHIQIHHPEYEKDFDSKFILEDPITLEKTLDADPEIKSYTLRSLQMGMISSPIKSNGVQIIGVNKEQEKKVTNLYTNLTEGSFFETKRKNAILIGEVLAKKLNVRLRSKVVLTFQENENNII